VAVTGRTLLAGRAKTEQAKDAGRPHTEGGMGPTEDAGMRRFAAVQSARLFGRGH
jgi:hypothetical protein